MNNEMFVDSIKELVREAAIEDTIENLEDPPGRKVSDDERRRSAWFNNLAEVERELVNSVIADAVDEALFGILTVIDGVRAIDNDPTSHFELVYKGKSTKLLNDPAEIGLHDLYVAKSAAQQ